MQKAVLMSAAYGWFAGLLTIMIVVTALFALILFIALKPIKKDELDDSSSAKKALGRRETELTIELLKKQNDAKSRAEIESKLREVRSAERLVEELMPEEENEKPSKGKPSKEEESDAPAAKPAQRPAARPQRPAPAAKPAAPAAKPAAKPAAPAAANPQQSPAAPKEAPAPAAEPAPAEAPKADGVKKEE